MVYKGKQSKQKRENFAIYSLKHDSTENKQGSTYLEK